MSEESALRELLDLKTDFSNKCEEKFNTARESGNKEEANIWLDALYESKENKDKTKKRINKIITKNRLNSLYGITFDKTLESVLLRQCQLNLKYAIEIDDEKLIEYWFTKTQKIRHELKRTHKTPTETEILTGANTSENATTKGENNGK